jgi:hypothetical protein
MPLIELEFASDAGLRISGSANPDLVAVVMKALPRR